MSADQPRVRPGVPASGQWVSFGHNDHVPGLPVPVAVTGPVFGLTPEYFDPADQAVYDRHERLLIDSDVDAAIEDNPVLLGGRTEFVATTAGYRFILGVTDAGMSVHRDPGQVPSDARDPTGFMVDTCDGAPTRPEHISEAMTYAVRRACFSDALHRAGIRSTDAVEFSRFTVHESQDGNRTTNLTITTAGGTFRLEARVTESGTEYGITDVEAGRFLTGRMADAVLLDAIEASGQKDVSAAAFIGNLTAAATAAAETLAHPNEQETP